MRNSGIMNDVVIIGGLISTQFVYAGNAMLMNYLMSLGLQCFTIVIYTSFATFLILLPFVLYFERYSLSLSLSFLVSIYFFFEMGFW
jgi:hypothetical protein